MHKYSKDIFVNKSSVIWLSSNIQLISVHATVNRNHRYLNTCTFCCHCIFGGWIHAFSDGQLYSPWMNSRLQIKININHP
mmetsp:Transcript_18079/g.37789  ORF Transcript_18079/g.37789 Transcript_18079/m.37789 type:complete len:80 (+) Transcript_18079:131-370(+)